MNPSRTRKRQVRGRTVEGVKAGGESIRDKKEEGTIYELTLTSPCLWQKSY